MSAKRFLWIGGILLGLNVLIFFSRKQGFDYKDFSSKELLYETQKPDLIKSFTNWEAFHFTKDDLSEAKKMLDSAIRIDTCKSDFDKLISLDHYLYQSICADHEFGHIKKSFKSPMALFWAIKNNKKELFHCGQAAYLQAFFCTAIGLKFRYIQNIMRPPLNLPTDSHVFNEIWLQEEGKWVISDFYQNRHIIKYDETLLSAADFFDAVAHKENLEFNLLYSTKNALATIKTKIQDPLFSDAFYLHYYTETNPKEVYSLKNKFRHYLLDYSHFQIYDPLESSSNFRHRVKQFAFFGWLLWLVIFAVRLTKRIP